MTFSLQVQFRTMLKIGTCFRLHISGSPCLHPHARRAFILSSLRSSSSQCRVANGRWQCTYVAIQSAAFTCSHASNADLSCSRFSQGGAGVISRDTDPVPYVESISRALDAAVRILDAGHAPDGRWIRANVPAPPLALAACLEAVECFEANDLFNAGELNVRCDFKAVEGCVRKIAADFPCGQGEVLF